MTLACLTAIVVATILSFLPAIDNEFLYWDDERNLMFNSHIRSFSAENLRWMWKAPLLGVWQPLTWMITAAEYQLFEGADLQRFSRGMHVASMVLHSVAAILAFFVIRRLIALGAGKAAARSPLGLQFGAVFAALLFAVHPLRVETVAWASGQAYVLAMIPALATVWCYLMAQQTGRKRWHAAALACLAASLLCKAMAVPLVAVLLVLDVYPLRRFGGAAGWNPRVVFRVLLEKIPYLLVTVVPAGMTAWATWATKDYRPEPMDMKILVASFCMIFYVSMTFVPYRPAPYYMRPTPFDAGDPWFVGAALLFVAVTFVLVAIRRRAPWLLAVWVPYVVTLIPNTGLVKHGGQMAADRYTYLSCIGWVVLVGAALLRIWAGKRTAGTQTVLRGGALAAGLAAVLGLGMMSRSYCRDWRDSESVWTAMIERNPRYHMGYYNLAKANKRPCRSLLRQARQAEREGDSETVAKLRREANERYRTAEANYDANVDLGNMIRQGKAPGGLEKAMEHYRTALRGRPGFHMAHLNLAYGFMQMKDYGKAIEHLKLAEADAIRAGQQKRLPSIHRVLAEARAKLDAQR